MRRLQINELAFKGQNIYVGIEVHLKSWTVTVLSEHSVLKKFSQNPDAESLHKFLTATSRSHLLLGLRGRLLWILDPPAASKVGNQ
jgi:fucose permease